MARNRYVIYGNPADESQSSLGLAEWLRYAAKQPDMTEREDGGKWFTDNPAHAEEATRCGLLVAIVDTLPDQRGG